MDRQMTLSIPVTITLPQAIGSKCYRPYFGKVNEYKIIGYRVGADGVEAIYYREKGDKPDDPPYVAPLDHVYFTYEEAEKMLEVET